MKDIRVLPIEERLAPLISQEEGYLVSSVPSNFASLLLEPVLYRHLSSFLIKDCSCGIPECRSFSGHPVITWSDRLASIHVISFDTKYQDKICKVQVIQSSDLSSLTLISHTSGFFRKEEFIGCYLKFTLDFAKKFPFNLKTVLLNSLNEESLEVVDELDSKRLKRIFGFASTKNVSAVFDFRLLLSDSNSTAKEVARREIKNYNSSLNSDSTETLDTANNWDENFFTVFPISSNSELITSSDFFSYCVFITFFALVLFFWKLIHTLFMKFVRFIGFVSSED
jgi:hypothetical protein